MNEVQKASSSPGGDEEEVVQVALSRTENEISIRRYLQVADLRIGLEGD
jgi:hypothetical protein